MSRSEHGRGGDSASESSRKGDTSPVPVTRSRDTRGWDRVHHESLCTNLPSRGLREASNQSNTHKTWPEGDNRSQGESRCSTRVPRRTERIRRGFRHRTPEKEALLAREEARAPLPEESVRHSRVHESIFFSFPLGAESGPHFCRLTHLDSVATENPPSPSLITLRTRRPKPCTNLQPPRKGEEKKKKGRGKICPSNSGITA